MRFNRNWLTFVLTRSLREPGFHRRIESEGRLYRTLRARYEIVVETLPKGSAASEPTR